MNYIIVLLIFSIFSFVFGCYLMKQTLMKKYNKLINPEENYLEHLILKELESLDYYNKKLNNIYLLKEDNKTTEIDIVYISEYGILVIEAKNYSGWIYGSEEDQKWTIVYQNGKKYSVYNPIKQNNGHINYLSKILNLNKDIFQSFIVFNDLAKFKKINCSNKNSIIKLADLKSSIVNNSIEYKLSKDKIEEIYNQLKKYDQPVIGVKVKHIEDISALKQTNTK